MKPLTQATKPVPGPLEAVVRAGPTPGPWTYQERSDAYTHIVRAGDTFLCQFGQDTSGRAEANARLTAAAPDLLAALEMFIQCVEQPTSTTWEAYKAAREAILKAMNR